MKKLFFICILLFLSLQIFKKEEPKEIRVRVIPNSNSTSDLKIKEEVKKYLCIYLEDLINENDSLDEIKLKIKNNINNLESNLIKLYGDIIDVSFNSHKFKNKSVNNLIVDGGNYLTLLIKINKAKGDNWWGTIYPELFSISSDEKIEYKSYILEILKRG